MYTHTATSKKKCLFVRIYVNAFSHFSGFTPGHGCVHSCNTCPLEAEAEAGTSEFKASQGYMVRPCLKS